jgi:hypothetical protein
MTTIGLITGKMIPTLVETTFLPSMEKGTTMERLMKAAIAHITRKAALLAEWLVKGLIMMNVVAIAESTGTITLMLITTSNMTRHIGNKIAIWITLITLLQMETMIIIGEIIITLLLIKIMICYRTRITGGPMASLLFPRTADLDIRQAAMGLITHKAVMSIPPAVKLIMTVPITTIIIIYNIVEVIILATPIRVM